MSWHLDLTTVSIHPAPARLWGELGKGGCGDLQAKGNSLSPESCSTSSLSRDTRPLPHTSSPHSLLPLTHLPQGPCQQMPTHIALTSLSRIRGVFRPLGFPGLLLCDPSLLALLHCKFLSAWFFFSLATLNVLNLI